MTTILIADDHSLICKGICHTLQEEDDLEIVAEAHSGKTAIDLCIQKQPDIAIVDINFPDIDGFTVVRQMLESVPDIKILAISMHKDKQYIQNMLDAGASGFVLKSSSFEEMIKAIRAIMLGIQYFCPDTIQLFLKSEPGFHQNPVKHPDNPLTPRETTVLQLISEGMTNKTIAKKLGIQPRTAEIHRMNIKKTLRIKSTAGLTKFAIKIGLTSPL